MHLKKRINRGNAFGISDGFLRAMPTVWRYTAVRFCGIIKKATPARVVPTQNIMEAYTAIQTMSGRNRNFLQVKK
jgi:hypothetical protein